MKIAEKVPDAPSDLLTLDDVARRLAVPRVVVCLCVMMEYLPAVHVAGVPRFRRADVEEFVARGGAP